MAEGEVPGKPAGTRPKVSVMMKAYNHGPFIAQAVESVLGQETGFDFELVVGEDCSTDNTAEILSEYARRHPGRIRLLRYGKNIGRARNFIQVFRESRGQYLAMLEGDDYWTDPGKLQKQVDRLDADPSLAICYHEIALRRGDSVKVERPKPVLKQRYTFGDLLRSEIHIHTSSALLRNVLPPDLPRWFEDVAMSDLPLFLLTARHGDILHLDDLMSVYRIHEGGCWSSGGAIDESARARRIKLRRAEGVIHCYGLLNAHLGFDHDAVIRRKIAMWHLDLAWGCRLERDWGGVRRHLGEAFRASPATALGSPGLFFKSLAVSVLPFLEKNRGPGEPGGPGR